MSIAGTISMTDTQFGELRTIIYDRAGIHLPDTEKHILESRLTHRLHELNMESFSDYIAFLSIGPYQNDEFQEMFNRITFTETSFFRDEPQLDVFEKRVLPELLEMRRGTRRLRIWSAACSTGDEPYTIAIMLHRSLGARLSDWRIEILGTDISEKALETANSGVFHDSSVRSTSTNVKQRYFRQQGSQWTIDPLIKQMVSFDRHNLKDQFAARRYGTWDVIFCRNVLACFDEAMKARVFKMFADQLADDGTLFIGHSETIPPGEAPFESMQIPQGFCYRKTKGTRTGSAAA